MSQIQVYERFKNMSPIFVSTFNVAFELKNYIEIIQVNDAIPSLFVAN